MYKAMVLPTATYNIDLTNPSTSLQTKWAVLDKIIIKNALSISSPFKKSRLRSIAGLQNLVQIKRIVSTNMVRRMKARVEASPQNR